MENDWLLGGEKILNIFSTLKEKSLISARPSNIFYIFNICISVQIHPVFSNIDKSAKKIKKGVKTQEGAVFGLYLYYFL